MAWAPASPDDARVAEVSGALAHALNNPLAVCLGRLEWSGLRSGPPEADDLRALARQTWRMRALLSVFQAWRRTHEVSGLHPLDQLLAELSAPLGALPVIDAAGPGWQLQGPAASLSAALHACAAWVAERAGGPVQVRASLHDHGVGVLLARMEVALPRMRVDANAPAAGAPSLLLLLAAGVAERLGGSLFVAEEANNTAAALLMLPGRDSRGSPA